MDYPRDFRCPISMELMENPVIISTGVTYEQKNIEKWFFTYQKKTCPTTMQTLHSFDITPNHTLKRLILSWQPPTQPPSQLHEEIASILSTIQSSPFKVSSLKKLRAIIDMDDEKLNLEFIRLKGVDILIEIIVQILVESSDFIAFRACEEALGVLHNISLDDEELKIFELLSRNNESIKSMVIILQRGSVEARRYAITLIEKIAKKGFDWTFIIHEQGIDFFKSLLELVSDEICTKASSLALEVLIEVLGASKKTRKKVIEAGAICVLIELLPDSNRHKCEKILLLIKLLSETAEGRLELVEHGMGIAAISKKLMNVSNVATKIIVKIFWLISNFHSTEKVREEMLIFGSVNKLMGLLQMGGRSSTKFKIVKIFKMNGNSWKNYPCCPFELKNYLG